MFALNGRPPSTYGFQSGMSGSRERVYAKNGWNCATASAISQFAPRSRTPSGRSAVQGAIDHRTSVEASVRPGTSEGATNASASTA
jgi:hypothetical protein